MAIKKRSLFKNKNAIISDVLFFTIDLVITVLVFFLLANGIDNFTESLAFEKGFLARDIAILTDTIYASPGNVVVDYPQNTFWFSFKFDANQIQVFEKESDFIKHSYYFMEDLNLDFGHKIIKPKKEIETKKSFIEKYLSPISFFAANRPELPEGASVEIRFAKTGNKLVIDHKESFSPDIKKLTCPGKKPAAKLANQKILIDPWIANRNSFDESEITADIGFAFKVSAGQKTNVISTRIESLEGKWLGRTENYLSRLEDPATSMIIGIHTGSDDDKSKNDIKAYISSDSPKSSESSNLACYILNEILDESLPVTEATIIPIDTTLPENKEAKQMLDNDKISILLEIGNIKIEQNQALLDKNNRNAIGAAIYDALEKYHAP